MDIKDIKTVRGQCSDCIIGYLASLFEALSVYGKLCHLCVTGHVYQLTDLEKITDGRNRQQTAAQ